MQNKNIKVSIIVPVYNPGDSIDRCIDSLINQTLKDIEIIFIDDASTDDSTQKIQELSSVDSRIKLILNKENCGSGVCRNQGIDLAQGEYLAFVDADDTIANDFLEKLYARACEKQLEIVKGDRIRTDVDGSISKVQGETTFNQSIKKSLEQNQPLYLLFNYNHWCALYQREFIQKNNVYYGLSRNGQDTTFLLKACFYCKSFDMVDDAYYYYNIGQSSSRMKVYSFDRLDNELLSFQEQVSFIKDTIHDNYYEKYLERRMNYYLSLHETYRLKHGNTPEVEKYYNALSSTLKEIVPDSNLPLFKALLNHQGNLCDDFYYPPGDNPGNESLYLNRLERWVNYLNREDINEQSKAYFLDKIYPKINNLYNKTDEQSHYKNEVNNLLKQLKTAPKISVIIPVYNPGKSLQRCLNSLSRQTLKDFEMIFIDDCGSRDDIQPLKKFAGKDARVRMIKNNENQGPGLSRRNGLEIAIGEYISFVDADDYISDDFFEILYSLASTGQKDIVKGKLIYEDRNGEVVKRYELNKTIRKQRSRENPVPLYVGFNYQHYTGLFRRQFLIDQNIIYPEFRKGEDSTFLLLACSQTESFDITDDAVYYFCENLGSIMHQKDINFLHHQMYAVKSQLNYMMDYIPHDEYAIDYIDKKLKYTLSVQASYAEISEYQEEAERFLKELQTYFNQLPIKDKVIAQSIPLRAFSEYGVNVSDQLLGSFWVIETNPDYSKLFQRWAQFIQENDLYDSPYYEEFRKELSNLGESIDLIVLLSDNQQWDSCIDSFLDQTYKNLKIVLIDTTCDAQYKSLGQSYEKKNKKLSYIHFYSIDDTSFEQMRFTQTQANYYTIINEPLILEPDSIVNSYEDLWSKNSTNIKDFERKTQSNMTTITENHSDQTQLTLHERNSSPTVKVSVIVPMYNCEKYLDSLFECFDNQTFTSFEVICVDDGSTDNTLNIIKERCQKDERYHYLSKPNGGAGTARNEGLKLAQGEYVIWLDADDTYYPNMLKVLVEGADKHQADITLCQFEEYNYTLKRRKTDLGFPNDFYPKDACVNPDDIKWLYRNTGYNATNKLYRKDFVIKNDLKFSATHIANDVFFIYASVSLAERILGIEQNLFIYNRNMNPDSLSAHRQQYLPEVIDVLNDFYAWLKEKNLHIKNLDSYIELVVGALHYNLKFNYNHEFYHKVVDTLCTKEPWINMSSQELYDKLWSHYKPEWLQTQITKLQKSIDNHLDEYDYEELIRQFCNKTIAVQLIEKMAQDEYGVTLNPFSDANKIKSLQHQLDTTKAELKDTEMKLNDTEKRLEREVDSLNYKLGYRLTYVPKKVYYFFKKKKD